MRLDSPTVRALGMVSGLGFAVALFVGGGVWLGLWLDARFGTRPILLLVGVVVGLVLAAFTLVRLTRFRGRRE